MTREWVDAAKPAPRRGPDTRDRRWVMRCDVGEFGAGPRCPTESEPQRREPDLDIFIVEGWFIAEKAGDICPVCLAAGVKPSGPGIRRWLTWNNLPHPTKEVR